MTLMFFNPVKSFEVKKCKIDKHMELGLYRQPIINFKGPKSKRQAGLVIYPMVGNNATLRIDFTDLLRK